MRTVNQTISRRIKRNERGTSVVIIALVLVAILGCAALVVDIGALHQERRTLQNGADAAALAVARDCIDGDCSDVMVRAQDYANSNADDGKTTVETLCGKTQGKVGLLPACSPAVPLPSGALGYTKAVVHTLNKAGGSQVMFGFGRIFGLTGQQVKADAHTAWGSPESQDGPTIFVSECAYNTWKTVKADIVIKNTYDTSSTCKNDAGNDNRDGFTWNYDGNQTDCQTTAKVSYNASGELSEVTPYTDPLTLKRWTKTNCPTPTLQAMINKQIRIPLWESSVDCGGHLQYRLTGFALFRVTGIKIAEAGVDLNISAADCPDGRCLKGHFETLVEIAKDRFGGKDFGILTYRSFDADNPDGNFT